MTDTAQASVAIVGAGPVGLCLAMDLAWRGVDCIVIELRAAGEPPSVKCNHVASRTMEAFRRLGMVQEVRAAGLPDDYPTTAPAYAAKRSAFAKAFGLGVRVRAVAWPAGGGGTSG